MKTGEVESAEVSGEEAFRTDASGIGDREWYTKGLRDGVPIAAGYFAVSLALGIAARNVGFSALQATAMSGLFHASAGEYVAITLAGAGAAYIEACMMELVANIRYLLLSFSLSQKLKTGTPLKHRLVLAYFLTDEIFGLSIRVPGFLNPFYSYGMITVASPAWILGSLFGVVLGNVLSARIVSALGISLFGMFLAIIIPPAKKDAVLLFFVTLAMLFSGLFSYLPLTSRIAPGLRTLLLTVGLSLAAALLFPRERVASEAEPVSESENVPDRETVLATETVPEAGMVPERETVLATETVSEAGMVPERETISDKEENL